MNTPWTLKGKTVLITGANTGIGRVTAVELAQQGAQVWLACRSLEKTEPLLNDIRADHGKDAAHHLPLDLGNLRSVRFCAQTFLAQGRPLHVLVNNAGVAGKGLTADGFEENFGVNHLGHFLLTELLRPRLVESAPARVVVVASRAHVRVKGVDFDALRKPATSRTGFAEYSQSKLCNILHARVLAAQLEAQKVTVNALHPAWWRLICGAACPWFLRGVMGLFMVNEEKGRPPQRVLRHLTRVGRAHGPVF